MEFCVQQPFSRGLLVLHSWPYRKARNPTIARGDPTFQSDWSPSKPQSCPAQQEAYHLKTCPAHMIAAGPSFLGKSQKGKPPQNPLRPRGVKPRGKSNPVDQRLSRSYWRGIRLNRGFFWILLRDPLLAPQESWPLWGVVLEGNQRETTALLFLCCRCLLFGLGP